MTASILPANFFNLLRFSAVSRNIKSKSTVVTDSNGQLIADFAAGSRLDVGRKLVPTHYDAFRLHVSSSYRQLFDRSLRQILQDRGWQIVRISAPQARATPRY